MNKQLKILTLVIILCFILGFLINFLQPRKFKVLIPPIPEIQKLYGNQDIEIIKDRMSLTKDDFGFFRSFIPLFYKIILDSNASDFPLNRYDYKKFEGIICGDLHPNNLSPIFNDFSDPEIALNDPDDIKKGYYLLDFFRFLVSLRFWEEKGEISNVPVKEMLETYILGLSNKHRDFSELMIKSMTKAKEKGEKIKKSLKENRAFTVLKNFKIAERLSIEEKNEIINALSFHFLYPIKIIDGYKTYKLHGGAGGLSRINLLIGVVGDDNDDKMQWIELKEIFLQNGVDLDEYKSQVHLILGENFKNTFQVLQYKNRIFYLKHHWKGQQNFDVNKFDNEEFLTIIFDQAYVIGKIHRRSMEYSNLNPNEYIKFLETITLQDWINSINYIHEAFVGFFIQSH